MLYGPIAGAVAGAVGDVLGFIVSPNGGFFPGFTLSAFITGLIYGLLLYKRPVSVKRAALAEGIIIVVCNLILTPIWLSMLYGTDLIAIPRIIRNIIMFPVHMALTYSVLKGVRSFRKTAA